ncbi:hypothetical protein FIV00_02940 [Labrenzia sp. THAF82]|nr:hypothetical protein FIV00_02940 [Labrenzia sp. THAF82]
MSGMHYKKGAKVLEAHLPLSVRSDDGLRSRAPFSFLFWAMPEIAGSDPSGCFSSQKGRIA